MNKFKLNDVVMYGGNKCTVISLCGGKADVCITVKNPEGTYQHIMDESYLTLFRKKLIVVRRNK